MAPKRLSVVGVLGKDKTLPNVPLTLNGTTYHLCYSFNGIAVAEELTGLELLAGSMDLQNMNASRFRAMLYASLLKGQPKITIDEVGDLINPKSIPEIVTALVHAWTGSRPEVIIEKDEKPNPDEPLEQ